MKPSLILVSLLFLLSCQESKKSNNLYQDRWSKWVIENEESMNYELNLKLTNLLDEEIKDTNWISKSIVVTKYDTTILGSFAKIIGETNICYLTEYSFFRDSTKKKELKIIKEDSSICKGIIDSIFSTTNSTKFFNLKIEKSQ